ncbi:SH3 domain-containing protein [Myxococcus fulvus]|nr:SH3 domain-containing protein [Myxococcus fulvus]
MANATVQQAVPPAMQPAAKAVVDFAVSSFEQGKPARAPMSLQVPPPPPPPLMEGGGQGNATLEVGDVLQVTSGIGVNLRETPSADSKRLGGFGNTTRLEVVAPPEGTPEQNGFVYVSGPDGARGWVSTEFTRELTEAEAAQAPATTASSTDVTTEAAAAYQPVYVDQFKSEKDVGGDEQNANCGPAATLTALRNEGLEIPLIDMLPPDSLLGQRTTGAEVQAVRYWGNQENDSGDDGVTTDADGKNILRESENGHYTGIVDIQNAVTKAGGTTASVAPNTTAIAEAVRNGSTVVVLGTFLEYVKATPETPEALRAPGDLVYADKDADGVADTNDAGEKILATQAKSDTWTRGGGAVEHFVAVVGMAENGNFIVCDPAHPLKAPIEVEPSKLAAFMRGNGGTHPIAVNGASTSETETTGG